MGNERKLRVLLATGIYPPDIGGPATVAGLLASELPRQECEVVVVTYGESQNGKCVERDDKRRFRVSRQQNILVRYWRYFREVWRLSEDSDVIYSFDLLSVGLPCALVKLFRPRIKFIVRLGGDFQYEAALQRGKYAGPLESYYQDGRFSGKERLMFYLTSRVLERTDRVVFNSEMLRAVYVKRGLPHAKAVIIRNARPQLVDTPAGPSDSCPTRHNGFRILFAGRLTAVRNLLRMITAIIDIEKKPEFQGKIRFDIFGDGPEKARLEEQVARIGVGGFIRFHDKVERSAIRTELDRSDLAVMPSLTEINSHFVNECLAAGKPIVLTKHTELHVLGVQNRLIYYVDPLDSANIVAQTTAALQDAGNGRNQPVFVDIDWPLQQVIATHLSVFND